MGTPLCSYNPPHHVLPVFLLERRDEVQVSYLVLFGQQTRFGLDPGPENLWIRIRWLSGSWRYRRAWNAKPAPPNCTRPLVDLERWEGVKCVVLKYKITRKCPWSTESRDPRSIISPPAAEGSYDSMCKSEASTIVVIFRFSYAYAYMEVKHRIVTLLASMQTNIDRGVEGW